MMKNRFLQNVVYGVLIMISAVVGGCSDDDPVGPEVQQPMPGEEGFFVINAGALGHGNATLSYFDKETKEVTNDLFTKHADRPLGDQAQSMHIFNGNGYILVQNSAKIEVIDTADFSPVKTIGTEEGITSPRYMLGINENKAYVSDWGEDGMTGTVKVLDLETFKVIKTISTGKGANELVMSGNKVYVTNNGGWGTDSTVAIIDSQTDKLIKKVVVGHAPSALEVDADGNIWVAGAGKVAYNDDWSVDEANSTPGFIVKINSNDEVELNLPMEKVSAGPGDMEINITGAELYYTYSGAVYSMTVAPKKLPETKFIDKKFNGIAVDPSTGDIIGMEAPNFTSAGKIYRYSSTGQEIDNYTVGIGPVDCAFK